MFRNTPPGIEPWTEYGEGLVQVTKWEVWTKTLGSRQERYLLAGKGWVDTLKLTWKLRRNIYLISYVPNLTLNHYLYYYSEMKIQ